MLNRGHHRFIQEYTRLVTTRNLTFRILVVAFIGILSQPVCGAEPGYVTVVSQACYQQADWKPVADALIAKHAGELLQYDKSVKETIPALRQRFPRFVCFVCQPEEVTREFVADVHRLTRQLDADPYTDVIWGIVTGYDAAGALRIAKQADPLEIHRVAAGTDIELSLCDEGVWYCELNRGKMVRKLAGKPPEPEKGPSDTTKALVDTLNEYHAQLFVTSGHATERDWQIGFRYRNGQFRSEQGQLVGIDTRGERFPIHSENPKVYLAVGNCLMGHIDGPDAMALAFLNSAGVCQMVGYTVPTWYGYGGWGLLDYFLEQPGRFTAAEAFFANQQALVHLLKSHFPDLKETVSVDDAQAFTGPLPDAARKAGLSWDDARGLLFDRDVVAFYGDPAWVARMAPGSLSWDQQLTVADDQYCLEVKPLRGADSFRPINVNGSQRGGRPILCFLPQRIQAESLQITEGADLQPLITDNFVLLPLPESCDPDRVYRITFRANSINTP
jgi:zinc protease